MPMKSTFSEGARVETQIPGKVFFDRPDPASTGKKLPIVHDVHYIG
jgi:hypothetical protein